jgi:hypothetical protein
MSDLTVQRDGDVFLLRSISEAGAKWIDENLIIRWNDEDGTLTGFERRGDAVVVEASIVEDMVENIEKDNLTVGFLN